MNNTNPWLIRGVSSPTLHWGATSRNGTRHQCKFCGITLLTGERSGFCCGPNGSRLNDVPPLPPLPDEFNTFLDHPDISKLSRILNTIFSFASMETTHQFPNVPGGPSFVAIEGKVYHRVRPSHHNSAVHWLLHDGFLMDSIPHQDLAGKIPQPWLTAVRSGLLRINPFVQGLRHVASQSVNTPTAQLVINDIGPANEIAALISFENTAISDVSGRRLVISRHNNTNRRINVASRLWEPLAYPLLFPAGTLGWGVFGTVTDVDQAFVHHDHDEEAVTTQMWHYRARILREPRFSIFGRLLCEYLVDMHTRDIESRLIYIYNHHLRRQKQEATDSLLMGEEELTPNENIYLPASFLGSRRWASEQVADSLAIAAALGEPHFFITMTCNPEWPEITSQLRPGQNWSDAPIVVVRVFKQKLRILLNTLKTMFPNAGKPLYSIYCIEFQKRGLPHVHILIKYPTGPCNTPASIDSIVSAELPDDPVDRELVKKFMLHHHPDSPQERRRYCQKEMPDGSWKCRFAYPHPVQNETTIDLEGRVCYRRRREEDRMVVPHCLPLIRMMKCHINFEVSSTSHLFQYLFKYIHKGPDRARYRVVDGDSNDPVNEIEDYWNARYLSAGEAAWRILGFRITHKDPSVTSLPIHLEDNQSNLRFSPSDNVGSLSKLERYFLRPDGSFQDNGIDRLFSDLTYTEYFTLFRLATYDPAKNGDPLYFRERPNGVNAPQMHVVRRSGSTKHIARIQTARPTQGEVFYLRVVLANRPARSFEDARTLAGICYPSFQVAAIVMGLFDDDNEAMYAIAEAVQILRTPQEMRVLFVHLLVNDCVPAAIQIWDRFWKDLSFDFILRNRGSDNLGSNEALQQMAHFLSEYGKSLDQYGLPQPTERMGELLHELRRWAGREADLNRHADQLENMFNDRQLLLYNFILNAVLEEQPLCCFVDGKAGTGKTTVVRALCSKLRGSERIVLATATSAFAAQLYEGGRTTHSTFKVPVNERNEMLQSTITPNSSRAELIREAALIIWDEAPMANKAVLGCVNDILCDVMGNNLPFGGKVMVLLGDFRQTCPVIRGGSRAEVVAASIKSSPLWNAFTVFQLTQPIRNAEDAQFSCFVNAIGDGGGPEVPLTGLNIVEEKDALTHFVFPDEILQDPQRCMTRSILAPTNRQVDEYNARILERLPPAARRVYFAADTLEEAEDANVPPPESVLDYVRTHTPPGFPPHCVTLHVGCVCRLLRNFSIDRGLVKNVRVVVKGVENRLVTVQVLRDGGQLEEEDILIPRITFKTELRSGHTLARKQFPLAPAYATTFNSCQGLTLDKVGVDLTSPVFSHGQLYTAMSRIRNRNDAIIRLPPGDSSTTNVTYTEILQ